MKIMFLEVALTNVLGYQLQATVFVILALYFLIFAEKKTTSLHTQRQTKHLNIIG